MRLSATVAPITKDQEKRFSLVLALRPVLPDTVAALAQYSAISASESFGILCIFGESSS